MEAGDQVKGVNIFQRSASKKLSTLLNTMTAVPDAEQPGAIRRRRGDRAPVLAAVRTAEFRAPTSLLAEILDI